MSELANVKSVEVVINNKNIAYYAEVIAAGGLFGVTNPNEALTMLLMCRDEGITVTQALNGFHIVKGKMSMKAETMYQRFLQLGGRVEWHELTEKRAEATFTHPEGGTIRLDWTIEMAQKAQLMKNPPWNYYPRAMLKWRLVSEGIKTIWPITSLGLMTQYEAQDIPDKIIPSKKSSIENLIDQDDPPLLESETLEGVVDANVLERDDRGESKSFEEIPREVTEKGGMSFMKFYVNGIAIECGTRDKAISDIAFEASSDEVPVWVEATRRGGKKMFEVTKMEFIDEGDVNVQT